MSNGEPWRLYFLCFEVTIVRCLECATFLFQRSGGPSTGPDDDVDKVDALRTGVPFGSPPSVPAAASPYPPADLVRCLFTSRYQLIKSKSVP